MVFKIEGPSKVQQGRADAIEKQFAACRPGAEGCRQRSDPLRA
jgi:hypothetical protein